MIKKTKQVNTYYSRARTRVADLIPEAYNKVLEIGCAEGIFRTYLNECEYWGVEPVPEVASTASEKLDKVLVGIYEDVADELPEQYFDLVICNDVIEHMVNHDKFLEDHYTIRFTRPYWLR